MSASESWRSSLLEWVRAGSMTLVTYLALSGMNFGPGWGAVTLALAAGALTFASVGLGGLVVVISLSLPMLAAAPLLGCLFLVLGLLALRYLTSEGGGVLFVVAGAIAGGFYGPAWAAVALAGYVLGATEGAFAAAAACLVVEILGIVLGRQSIGVFATGGSTPLLALSEVPQNLFSASWLGPALGSIDASSVESLIGGLKGIKMVGVLIAQPIVWAATAAVTGVLARSLRSGKAGRINALAAGAGILIPAVAASILLPLLGFRLEASVITFAAVTSLIVALPIAVVADNVTRARNSRLASLRVRPGTMAAEDADVDELLRLIATAEDKLTTHTSTCTVLITDMKSFSRMTEEDGSMLTAKAIQRHRDLLLPVIEQYGGRGKSTGGDGLVASFEDAESALSAASAIQQRLSSYNLHNPEERDLIVRVGIADGEVVLDRAGRPFIGAGLNLAARVMNLADGGQVFATQSVVQKAGKSVRVHSHGAFELKNIAEPVEVLEVLWSNGQQPLDPRVGLSA